MDVRLIERWMPIAALSEESVRERRSMTALPPIYYLHVWWARRPLVASRAAALASLLPADADRDRFLHAIGIHGDPVAAKSRIEQATKEGRRLGAKAYGYARAFTHIPDESDREWFRSQGLLRAVVLDPTAGGGSIPFECMRLGLETLANDLNPVAGLVEMATVEWPRAQAGALASEVSEIGRRLVSQVKTRLEGVFPNEPLPGARSDGYLWARTVKCPYCDGLVPLSPNWRLAGNGTGVRLVPEHCDGPGSAGRICAFEVVQSSAKQSSGTVSRGSGSCPYDDCGRIIDGTEIKSQAQNGRMGEQLYAVVFKERVEYVTKTGKKRWKWVRRFRAPKPEDDNAAQVTVRLEERLLEWEAFDYVPGERIPDGAKTAEPLRYGMGNWRDLFSPRQLLCHGTSVEVFREMLDRDRATGDLGELRRAAYGYLALSLDKLLNYNSRMSVWMPTREVIANTFNRHDFAMCWSYAEMAPLVAGVGYEWAVEQTTNCIRELVAMVHAAGSKKDLISQPDIPPPLTVTCKPGDSLDHVGDGSVDVVVIDPPYYDNVMYAELSDFFYVWLKRTAGQVFPELFRRQLTDKENEAVANPAKFQGEKGARALAGRDYQERMAAIFAECKRVLKPNGIMTLMFTHKATGAWDALTAGLIEAGFSIKASWPINTEASGSLHIKDKAAANSTIFLVCRPRAVPREEEVRDSPPTYWEDVEPRVTRAVRERMAEFEEAGVSGVDLFLAAFGPALSEFSEHWPLQRGTPRDKPVERRRKRQHEMFEEEWDPYAATPEDALDAARREVQKYRLERIANINNSAALDPATAFVVFAWDAFKAPVFAYDEALHLARSVGIDLDGAVIGRLAEKKASNILLWDSVHRAAKGALGPADGSRGMIDALHHAANLARRQTMAVARDMLIESGLNQDPAFLTALESLLEVLPPSSRFTGVERKGDVAGAANDFETLYDLYRLAFTKQIDEPKQLSLWR
ncbi:MAG: DUF1156 domain-containing protein [Gammaproteobacteria bacterium]|nr:DUF1156 domain-containing protein [Gammaproteobacteria bacterium]